MKKCKGITLIELLTVLVIAIILATIAIAHFKNTRQIVYDETAVSDIKNIQRGLEAYYADQKIYPSGSWTEIEEKIGFHASHHVVVNYDTDNQDYSLTTKHTEGKKAYGTSSKTSFIWYKSQDDNTTVEIGWRDSDFTSHGWEKGF